MTSELIRKRNRTKRDQIGACERKGKSELIAERILAGDISSCNDILCYYPLGSEPDLLGACRVFLEEGKRLYFPVTEKDGIHFYCVGDLKGFKRGVFNVMEPADRRYEYKRGKALSLTPGLAFDRDMNRIGYGGGYYDRFFSLHPDIIRAGICFDELLERSIPHERWDMRMDLIITDREVITRSGVKKEVL